MKFIAMILSLFLVVPLSFADSMAAQKNNLDPEIIATLVTINNNEISAANMVAGKTTNKKVKRYAQYMKEEHTKNLTATESLSKKQNIVPVNDQMTTDLKKHGEEEVTQLASLKDGDFDKVYINDMVKDHGDTLTLLDGFLKQVKNPKLKKHLLMTKMHVKDHLKKAIKIQKQLN